MELRSPPSPAELEASAAEHMARHRRRLTEMQGLKQTEVALQRALEQALSPLDVSQPPGWQRFLASLGLLALDPPPLPAEEQLWDRHERALEMVRRLGHDLDMLDRELALLDQDIAALDGQIREAAQCRGRAAAQATTLAARGADAWNARQSARRWEASVERWSNLLRMHKEVRAVLRHQTGELGELYRQTNAVLDGLGRHITDLAAEVATKVDERHFHTLRQSLGQLALVAETSGVNLRRDLDQLTTRLSRLDAEARHRAAAREEVSDVQKRRE
ncbi:MAG: hypothetical protein AAFV53_00675 [Myxococcota bacterium]